MKTSELTGHALNYQVHIAEGQSYWTGASAKWDHHAGYTDWILDKEGLTRWRFNESTRAGYWEKAEVWAPVEDWSQGGPIIERESMWLSAPTSYETAAGTITADCWRAMLKPEYTVFHGAGPTPLVAAMRCFVASKLGDEVDVPKELL